MRLTSLHWLAGLCLLANIPTELAATTLSIQANTDLARLAPGVPFSVESRLTGLPTDAGLDLLAVTLRYDPGLLSADALSPGAIVPSPLHDINDFLTLLEPGFVDVAFSTFSTNSAHHIRQDGAYFLVHFTPSVVGSGQISIDFLTATRFNPADPDSPLDVQIIAGTPLSFDVLPIPEPSALVLALCAGLVPAIVTVGRRWKKSGR